MMNEYRRKTVRWGFWFGAFIAAAALCSTASAKERTAIHLPESFVIADEEILSVTLGALVDSIAGGEPAFIQELSDLQITVAPKPGEQKSISNVNILHEIRKAKLDYMSIDLRGAIRTNIFGAGQMVSMDDMIDAIQKQILRETGWGKDELSMRVLSSPTQILWLPPGDVTLFVNPVSKQIQGASRYEVECYIERLQVNKAIFIVASEHRRTILVPKDDLKRGHVIQESDLIERVVFIDNESLDRQIVSDKEELIGARCKMPLSRNDPIKLFSLESNLVLRHGSPVTMIVRQNGMTMHTLAKAQKRAAPGDVIPVKTNITGQVVMAKVISRDLVEFAQ
ncbi:MAG: flagellar basal body P-ring formation chaperone FlgA [Candidatus Hinthialibacter antarcticus]|nr:flagellar basal body P-ring formation chaperone FlgA [Candidatus Hinthialibacter antarcticus]